MNTKIGDVLNRTASVLAIGACVFLAIMERRNGTSKRLSALCGHPALCAQPAAGSSRLAES